MAGFNLNESATFETNVPSIDFTDAVEGAVSPGVDPNTGIDNSQAVKLANRTKFLKQEQDAEKIVTAANTVKADANTIGVANAAAGIVTLGAQASSQGAAITANGNSIAANSLNISANTSNLAPFRTGENRNDLHVHAPLILVTPGAIMFKLAAADEYTISRIAPAPVNGFQAERVLGQAGAPYERAFAEATFKKVPNIFCCFYMGFIFWQ